MIAAHDSGLVTFDIALLKKAFVGQVSRKEWKTICATMKAAGY